MNVEIQQRACEYIQIFDEKWDATRQGLFEPIPFKGDLESKTFFDSQQADRPDFDDAADQDEVSLSTTTATDAGSKKKIQE